MKRFIIPWMGSTSPPLCFGFIERERRSVGSSDSEHMQSRGQPIFWNFEAVMEVEGMGVDGGAGAGGASDAHVLIHDEERCKGMVAQLRREKDRLSALPKNSQYVAHRMRVVNRALEILERQNQPSLDKHEDELAALLASLSL